MKLLLDTATFLWVTYDAAKLSPAARAAYADVDNQLHLSVVSLWEIIIKNRLGKRSPENLGFLFQSLLAADATS